MGGGAAIAVLAALLLIAPGAQAESAAKLGEFGTPFGPGNGELRPNVNAPGGIAVNRTGAGGVSPGEVYVVDSANSRVSEYTATGDFVRSFGYDVVASGPDDSGANEVQGLAISATGGSFALKLTRESTLTETTGAEGKGALTAGSKEVTELTTTAGSFAVGEPIKGSGIPAGTTIAALGSGALTLSAAVEAGKSAKGVALEAYDLPFNATAAEVQADLEGLPAIGAGNVAVGGGPAASAPLSIEYKGPLAHDEAIHVGSSGGGDPSTVISAAEGGLSGPTGPKAQIYTTSPGGGYEVCEAGAGDACQAAPFCSKVSGVKDNSKGICAETAAAGSVNRPEGVAIDQATGTLYVLDANVNLTITNSRVDAFSATGAFEGAFGWDTIPSGAQATGTLEAGSAEVKAVSTTRKAFKVGQAVSGSGIPAHTVIATVGESSLTLSQPATASGAGVTLTAPESPANVPGDERQLVSLGAKVKEGNFKLTFRAPEPQAGALSQTTENIPFNATAAQVEAALASLTGVGAGNVAVSLAPGGNAGGGTAPGGPWVVEFEGARYADTNLAQLTPQIGSPGLNGGEATVATLRDGGSLELCTAASGCQAATRGEGGGQLGNGGSIGMPAIDPTDGHLYVPDNGANHRIEEFAPTYTAGQLSGVAFVKALGWDVVASGPDQASEVQRVFVRATEGKFKLSYKASATAELPFDIPASGGVGPTASLENALNALPALSSAGFTVKVTGGPGGPEVATPTQSTPSTGFYEVTFESSPRGANANQLVAASAGLAGAPGESYTRVLTYAEGGGGLESCVAARGDVCEAAPEARQIQSQGQSWEPTERPNDHVGQFAGPASLAVDGSGALYAADPSGAGFGSGFIVAPSRVLKLGFPGAGEVEATELAPSLLTHGLPEESGKVNAQAVAVDPVTEHVWVAKKEGASAYRFLEFDSAGTLISSSPAGEPLPAARFLAQPALAVGTATRLYFVNPAGEVDILGKPTAPAAQIQPVTDIGSSSATFHGKVTLVAGLATSYRFEYSADGGSTWAPFPAADVPLGDGSEGGTSNSCPAPKAAVCEVSQEATDLEANTEYKVRLVATNGKEGTSGEEAFTTTTAAPQISATGVKDLARTQATLSALVNPGGLATSYRIQWGETEAYDHEATGNLPAGGRAVEVEAPLGGLEEGAAYHFRVSATNAEGETVGLDREFTTLDSFGLPAGRAPEQVSPADKRPAGSIGQLLGEQIRFQAADDGNAVIYPILNGLADATAGGNVEYLGTRGAAGWPWTQLSPPALVPALGSVGFGSSTTGLVLYASEDLSCELIETPQPLAPMTPELEEDLENGVLNLYRRGADGTYELLSPKPLNGRGGVFTVDGASEGCEHVLFESNSRLLPTAPPEGESGLYEWDEGTLRIAGVLPDASFPTTAVAGGANLDEPKHQSTPLNSISRDGSEVFFSAKSNEGSDAGNVAIFVRKNGTITADASQSHTATPDKGAVYSMASEDGNHVLFLANYGLATNGTSSGPASCDRDLTTEGDGAGCDLYRYDVETESLTDLSADANPKDEKGAGVVGVLDASANGSYVYFAARGQLVAGKGKSETQNLSAGSYNVYESHAGTLSYVGPIATADAIESAPSGSDLNYKMAHWVAQATPDGAHMLFVSKANVTGYVSGGASEVYLYSAADHSTVCVSCRADGQPSLASASAAPLKSPGSLIGGCCVSSGGTQSRPRAISEDGSRVFFTMPDALAAGANPGTRNVYEWHAGQVALLAAGNTGTHDFTEFADSSADGKDVFVVTREKLVPQDFDTTTDLYDLRIPHAPGEAVGPKPLEPEPEPCDPLEGACKEGAGPGPQAPGQPGSEGQRGAGNPVFEAQKTPKPRCRKGHRCHKAKGRHHRRHRKGRSAR